MSRVHGLQRALGGDGGTREAPKVPTGRQDGRGGVAPGSSTPIVVVCPLLPLAHVEGRQRLREARNVLLPPPSPRPGLSGVPRCHYTTRDLRARLVLQEASRGVLIKGHHKIDLPAHQKKCPPGK